MGAILGGAGGGLPGGLLRGGGLAGRKAGGEHVPGVVERSVGLAVLTCVVAMTLCEFVRPGVGASGLPLTPAVLGSPPPARPQAWGSRGMAGWCAPPVCGGGGGGVARGVSAGGSDGTINHNKT